MSEEMKDLTPEEMEKVAGGAQGAECDHEIVFRAQVGYSSTANYLQKVCIKCKKAFYYTYDTISDDGAGNVTYNNLTPVALEDISGNVLALFKNPPGVH